jgi:hypothetical protein
MPITDLNKFDGASLPDEAYETADAIVEAALEDERDHKGHVELSPTLACFLTCRIAQAIRELNANYR